MKKDLRFLLCEPFGGLPKDTVDELENVVKDFSVSFSLFCAENYTHNSDSNYWWNSFGVRYTTEQLFDLFIEDYER
jgi:hypothetical protein